MSLGVVAEPEHLTKDRLKQELERFDIPYEPNENKTYYVNLYKKKLLSKKSVRRIRSEFSSDEDIRFKKPAAAATSVVKKVYKKVSQDTYLDQVKKLSDTELASELQKYDSRIGPIVESTRAVYQRKLASLMSERLRKAAVDHRGEDLADHEESYSESEKQSSGEEEESVEYEPIKPAGTSPKASSYSHLVAPASFSAPKRPPQEYDEYTESKDAIRHAEPPASSKIPQVESKKFHKMDEGKPRQEFKSRKELNIPKHSSSTSATSKPQSQRQSMCSRIMLLQFLIAFIVAFFSYIIYTAPESVTQLIDQILSYLGVK